MSKLSTPYYVRESFRQYFSQRMKDATPITCVKCSRACLALEQDDKTLCDANFKCVVGA